MEQAEQKGHPLRFVPALDRVLPEEGQPHEAGGGRPVPGQAGRPAAGKAGLQPLPAPGQLSVIQGPELGMVQQIGTVPRVAGAVGHHSNRVPVDVQPVPVGLHHDALPGAVGKHPVDGRHGPQHGDGHQRHPLLQCAGHLLHRGAGGQAPGHQEGRLEGQGAGPRLRGKVGKRAVVELAAHQSLLVEALIQGRGGTQHQGADAHRSVGRRTAGGRLQIALQLGTAGVEHLSPWYKGHLAVRRNAVEIEVAPPQVSAVRRLPRHRAAPGGQVAQQRPRPALVRIHLLRLLLEPMCLWYTVCH